MGIFLLWATCAHEYMAVILTQLGQRVNEMMAVGVKHFPNF